MYLIMNINLQLISVQPQKRPYYQIEIKPNFCVSIILEVYLPLATHLLQIFLNRGGLYVCKSFKEIVYICGAYDIFIKYNPGFSILMKFISRILIYITSDIIIIISCNKFRTRPLAIVTIFNSIFITCCDFLIIINQLSF